MLNIIARCLPEKPMFKDMPVPVTNDNRLSEYRRKLDARFSDPVALDKLEIIGAIEQEAREARDGIIRRRNREILAKLKPNEPHDIDKVILSTRASTGD